MVAALLLALVPAAAGLVVETGDFAVEGAAGAEAAVEARLVANGTLHVEGPGAAALRPAGGVWGAPRNLPAAMATDPDACERGLCGVHRLRLTLRVPEEPATLRFLLADDAGGVVLSVRASPVAAGGAQGSGDEDGAAPAPGSEAPYQPHREEAAARAPAAGPLAAAKAPAADAAPAAPDAPAWRRAIPAEPLAALAAAGVAVRTGAGVRKR